MSMLQMEAAPVQVAGTSRQVLTGDDRKACVRMLFSMLKLQMARNRDNFPGGNPVSIERATLSCLAAEGYWVCAKTDGDRMFLMTVTLKGERLCLMVDRAMRMFVMTGHLPTMSFESSLLDGELVRFADGSWKFLVFDCVYLAGIDIAPLPFGARIEFVNSWLQDLGPGLHGIEVRTKLFAAYRRQSLPQEPGMPQDGLIFIPEHRPYGCHRNDHLFKWKADNRHTVDFKVIDRRLMVLSKSQLREKGCLHPEDDAPEGAIVECQQVQGAWRVVKVRTDKTAPNDAFVYGKTMLNIQENIGRSELGV